MTHLQEELEHLRTSLIDMAKLVRKQLKKSRRALENADADLANEVIFNEKRVNALELKIDKDCEHIFALLSPVAADMRFCFATLKINGELERIGDYAEGIAHLALLALNDFDRQLIQDLAVMSMFDTATEMLTDVTEAYATEDSRLARTVFSKDLLLNEANHNATAIAVEYCKTHQDQIAQALHLLSIIRRLERVGDHITNIAEEVIFFKEAKVLKHSGKEEED